MKKQKAKVYGVCIIAVCLLAISLGAKPVLRAWRIPESPWTVHSPCENYTAVAHKSFVSKVLSAVVMRGPGQGSDASGYVEIYDSWGNLIAERPLEMMQLIYDLRWEDNVVYLTARWEVQLK